VIILCALLAVREQDYFIFPISPIRKLACAREALYARFRLS
jgi:hypothetical protein